MPCIDAAIGGDRHWISSSGGSCEAMGDRDLPGRQEEGGENWDPMTESYSGRVRAARGDDAGRAGEVLTGKEAGGCFHDEAHEVRRN
jgi:hypothetical protein